MSDAPRHADVDGLVRHLFSAPFVVDLGMVLSGHGPGRCESVLELAPRHLQQDGYVHAGVLATMADHTAGVAAATRVGDGETVLTAEFKIHLLRAARGTALRCVGEVLKAGRRLTVAEATVHAVDDGSERLVAKASLTLAVVAAAWTLPGAGPAPG